ncbi:MAG: class I SAM-dependent methyltransferase [Actinomycetota bacterium]|nr:class I SAM-dependent methyltransferase [Actinomycetota bacterium]
MNIQIDTNNYFKSDYDTKERFISYWYQINEIISLKPASILEIGVGNSFVSNYLKKKGFEVTTLDIEPGLKPDIVGSVLSIPFSPNSFDVVACYEVLEHLPYKNFSKALAEIYRVCKNYAIISLPDRRRVYRFNLQIPRLGEVKKLIPLPGVRKIHDQHYWEIGGEIKFSMILSEINRRGFIIKKNYRIFEHPYHRFIIAEKNRRKVC